MSDRILDHGFRPATLGPGCSYPISYGAITGDAEACGALEEQHAPSTGQPCRECGEGMDPQIEWLHEPCTGIREYAAQIQSLQQQLAAAQQTQANLLAGMEQYTLEALDLKRQLAAAQAERDEFRRMASRFSQKDEDAMEIIHRAAELFRPDIDVAEQLVSAEAERDQLRAQVAQLRQRVGDLSASEGRAVAERNAAANEALGYKFQIEALRRVCAEWLPIVERQLGSLPPVPESRAYQTAVARVARLRAAVGADV